MREDNQMKKAGKKKIGKIRHPFLKGLSAEFQKFLLQDAEIISLLGGEFVFRHGERAEKFFLILKGRVDILSFDQDIRFDAEPRLSILQSLASGEIVGWSWVIPPYHWKFNAFVHEETELLAIDGKRIRARMAKDPKFAVAIYSRLVPVMNERLLASRMKFAMFGGKPFHTQEGG